MSFARHLITCLSPKFSFAIDLRGYSNTIVRIPKKSFLETKVD